MTTSMMQQTSAQFWGKISIHVLEHNWGREAYLKTAGQRIRNIVFEEVAACIVDARPAPHIFAVTLSLALIEESSADGPHNDAEDEEANCEDGVVRCHFLSSPMTTP